jgi:hypothetical protein
MLSMLSRGFAAFCVATVLTQLILIGYFLVRGTINAESSTKVIALLNGIDITGSRLQQILRENDDRSQPDFDEILAARKLQGYDMDLRLRSQREYRDELSAMQAEVSDERARLDERLAAFRRELEEIRQGVQQEGMRDVQRMIQSLDADQAKQHLLIMYEDERIDDVVTIVQAMPTEKRKDILAAFVTKDEADKLAEILRRIGAGMPTADVIDRADENR